MKAAEVLRFLDITRPTLCAYVKSGKITVVKKANGYYDYNSDSVHKFLNIDPIRYNAIYCRVSTHKQKNDLANQLLHVIDYCNNNNIKYDKIYQEIASGIDFDRSEFSTLLDDVIHNKVANIYITYKDRISRLSFITLDNIFKQFNTNIIAIDDKQNKNDENDLFDELISIIHLFSTKIYSKRRKTLVNKCFDILCNKTIK